MQQAAARAAGAAEDPQGAAGAVETDPEVVLTEGNAAVLDMKVSNLQLPRRSCDSLEASHSLPLAC